MQKFVIEFMRPAKIKAFSTHFILLHFVYIVCDCEHLCIKTSQANAKNRIFKFANVHMNELQLKFSQINQHYKTEFRINTPKQS